MAMESWWLRFISLCCNLFIVLNATHCFSFVQTKTLCHVDEFFALLQFKESCIIDRSASNDPFAYPKIASWMMREGDKRSNCCSWEGVECDEDTGHVIGLDLSSNSIYGSINSNSSLFQLVHLQRLDLSDNNFNSSEIPSILGLSLTSLTYLNLSFSIFSSQIPSEISKLSKLSTLDLSFNRLKLTKSNLRSLTQNLTNIKQLHLSGVEIYSIVPDTLVNASSLTSLKLDNCGLYGEFPVGIFHLPNLELLYLYNNPDLTGYFPNFNSTNSFKKVSVGSTKFSGELPTSIGNLHSLNGLEISNCNFYPHLPSSLANLTQLIYLDISSFYGSSQSIIPTGQVVSDSLSWVGKLTNLYHLGLARTKLSAKFPYFLVNLTQLEFLNLESTELTGQIPWLSKFTQLTHLDLSHNNLQGAIPRSLSHLKNLEYLNMGFNNLSGSVNLSLPKLETLGLGSCNLREFPEFLKTQYGLVHLDLSNNNIHGQIPNWMWNATRQTLLLLELYGNFLTGFDQNPVIIPWKNLVMLDIESNRLQGSLQIPPQSIEYYSASDNAYSGEISPLFCNLNHLHLLDLSNNNLSGMLPECFGNSSAFEILRLQNNSFHGHIPRMCSKENRLLKLIDLSYNQLQGTLPRSMANCTRLEALNFGNNQISDIFPSWLGALPALRALILRSNGFHGIIGKPATNHEFPKLCVIDLSNNGFSGMLPSHSLDNWNCMKSGDENNQTYFEINLLVNVDTYLFRSYYSLSMTIFGKGVELKYLKTPYLLKLIDLSSNRFEGEIPAGIIGNLRGLVLLNLSNNTLTGGIPSSLGNLTALESLDLSQNQLSGNLPSNLVQLTFLEYMNVSHNHLWGPIPLGGQLDTLSNDSYQGNDGLCGKPLSKKCEYSESSRWPTPSILEEEEDSGFQIGLDWYVVLPGVVSGLIVGVVAGNTFANKNNEWFVEKFSRKREPRGARRMSRRRT